MMNGFTASDMTDARAKGYQDRVEHENEAAAKEAVAIHQFRHHDSSDWYDVTPEDHPHVFNDPDFVVRTVYIAPVAAAPVVDGRDVRAAIAGIEGSVAVGSDGEWVSVRRTARDAAVTALRNLSSDCAHIYAAYAEAKASTPAAPGIDLEQLHPLMQLGMTWGPGSKYRIAAESLADLIDASPKGVTLRNDGSTVVTDAMIHAALRVQYARAGSVWTGSKANPDFTDMRHILSAAMQATSAEVGA